MNKILAISAVLLLSACYAENEEDLFPAPEPIPVDQEISFSMNVEPIMTGNCNFSGCHNNGSFDGDFTDYVEIKKRVDNGVFNIKVLDPSTRDMPRGNPDGLSESNRAILRRWISEGAKNN